HAGAVTGESRDDRPTDPPGTVSDQCRTSLEWLRAVNPHGVDATGLRPPRLDGMRAGLRTRNQPRARNHFEDHLYSCVSAPGRASTQHCLDATGWVVIDNRAHVTVTVWVAYWLRPCA